MGKLYKEFKALCLISLALLMPSVCKAEGLDSYQKILDDGSFFMQVNLNLELNNKPINIKRVVQCIPYEGFNGREKYTNFYLSPLNKILSYRLENNAAILVWTPEACQAAVVDKNDDSGELNFSWPAVYQDSFPLIGLLQNAQNADEVLLYASYKAYENPKAKLKYKGLTFSEPDYAALNKSGLIDEFWWLGNVQNVFFKTKFHEQPVYSGSYLLESLKQYKEDVQKRLPSEDVDKPIIFMREITIPEKRKFFNVPISDALFNGGGFLKTVFFTSEEKAKDKKERMLRGLEPISWIEAVPIQYSDKKRILRRDMVGFVYLYSQDFLEKNDVKNTPLFLTNEIEVAEKGNLSQPFYVQSLDKFFMVAGVSYHHFKQSQREE